MSSAENRRWPESKAYVERVRGYFMARYRVRYGVPGSQFRQECDVLTLWGAKRVANRAERRFDRDTVLR